MVFQKNSKRKTLWEKSRRKKSKTKTLTTKSREKNSTVGEARTIDCCTEKKRKNEDTAKKALAGEDGVF